MVEIIIILGAFRTFSTQGILSGLIHPKNLLGTDGLITNKIIREELNYEYFKI